MIAMSKTMAGIIMPTRVTITPSITSTFSGTVFSGVLIVSLSSSLLQYSRLIPFPDVVIQYSCLGKGTQSSQFGIQSR